MKAWTYITTNKPNGVLYTGVTSELRHRIINHKTKKYKDSFSARYNTDKLVWYKEYDSIIKACDKERLCDWGSGICFFAVLPPPAAPPPPRGGQVTGFVLRIGFI